MLICASPTNLQSDQCCVVSLAIGRSSYMSCLERLQESLKRVGFRGGFLGWSNELPPGSPTQLEAPMAFKTFCFREAHQRGYRYVLWLDAPMVALQKLDPIIEMVKTKGYILFNDSYGQSMGRWCSDIALEHHNIDREQSLGIPEIPTSAIGFDLESRIGSEFLNRWQEICLDGVTCRGRREPYLSFADHDAMGWNKNQCASSDPRVGGHRFDQTAAGLVAHELQLTSYADQLRDIDCKTKHFNRKTILLHCREYGKTIRSVDEIHQLVANQLSPFRLPVRALRKVRNKLNVIRH